MGQAKRLVVCFDGTWNTADNGGSPTNVVRIARMIPPDDGKGTKQFVFYDQGVGTWNKVDRLLGGSMGRGLEQHVKLGYLFLAQNYEPGDQIYVFGFSRGAFSARSLVGFIGACRGLLLRDKLYKLEQAWRFYRTPPDTRNGFQLHNEIEANVHKDTCIDVLGVWDTVGALGIPSDWFNTLNRARYSFHDTELSKSVRNAFQALAIDEKRAPFSPSLWRRPKKPIAGQIVEQVWFAGVHSDVGGGYENSELSDLTLRWMMARTMAHSDLVFDQDKIDYFLPDTAAGAAAARRDERIERIREKWQGTLHDSLGHYPVSRINPRIRVIGGHRPALGTGPWPGIYRLAEVPPGGSFCEAIHWSVRNRLHGWKTAELPSFIPPNLRAAIDHMPIVEMGKEIRKGTPWAEQWKEFFAGVTPISPGEPPDPVNQ